MQFDSKLTFEDYVICVMNRVAKKIGILRLVRGVFVKTSVLVTVVTVYNSMLVNGAFVEPLCW